MARFVRKEDDAAEDTAKGRDADDADDGARQAQDEAVEAAPLTAPLRGFSIVSRSPEIAAAAERLYGAGNAKEFAEAQRARASEAPGGGDGDEPRAAGSRVTAAESDVWAWGALCLRLFAGALQRGLKRHHLRLQRCHLRPPILKACSRNV